MKLRHKHPVLSRSHSLSLLLGVCLLAACNRPRYDTPVAAYTSFARAYGKGDAEQVYKSLSNETQKVLEARAEEISAAADGSVRSDPVSLFYVPSAIPPPLTDVRVLESDGKVATLQVAGGGQEEKVRMVKEGESWRVDLTEALTGTRG